MGQLLLIDCDPHQSRVALLEDDRLTEIYLERRHHRGMVGNVYKGRVTRVLPGIQAAFVDLGLERDAFLYVDDARMGEALEEDDGELDVPPNEAPRSIEDLLSPGQELLVQVLKDPLPNKGARISTQITLPGRLLVLLPTVNHLGVSRRIEDEQERQRLRDLLERIRPAQGGGLIVRTVGLGRAEKELAADCAYLERLWAEIRRQGETVSAPRLIHQDLDLPLRAVRDLFGTDIEELWVADEPTYSRIVEFLEQMQSGLMDRVRLADGPPPLFERFGVEREIEGALRSRVWLRSGGYIVINPTEALVAIDVNTGRFVGRSSLEETVIRINLEATQEIVRHIRLRDLAGIIVIDFIDMVEPENRRQLFAALEAELKKDRAKNKVLNISDFGLVEITRKRSRANLQGLLTQSCPYCDGSGRIKSLATLCLELRREVLAWCARAGRCDLHLEVHGDVAHALANEERAILEELRATLGVSIRVEGVGDLHHERFRILPEI